MLRIFFKYRNMCVTEKTSKERIRCGCNPFELPVFRERAMPKTKAHKRFVHFMPKARTQTTMKRFFRKD